MSEMLVTHSVLHLNEEHDLVLELHREVMVRTAHSTPWFAA